MSTTAVSHFVTRCKTRWWRVCFSRLVWTVLKTQTLPTHYTCPAAGVTPKKKRNQRFTHVNYTQLKQQRASSSVCLLHVQKFRFRVFLKFYVWPNGWHLRLCPPRPLANCRCVSVGVRRFWLGSCLSQNRENYKAEAVWGCMQAFIAPLLLACRAECSGGWSCSKWRGGDEIDRQCHSAHNRVWFHLGRKVNRKMPQATTQIYRNAPQKFFFSLLLLLTGGHVAHLAQYSHAANQSARCETKRKLPRGQWDGCSLMCFLRPHWGQQLTTKLALKALPIWTSVSMKTSLKGL